MPILYTNVYHAIKVAFQYSAIAWELPNAYSRLHNSVNTPILFPDVTWHSYAVLLPVLKHTVRPVYLFIFAFPSSCNDRAFISLRLHDARSDYIPARVRRLQVRCIQRLAQRHLRRRGQWNYRNHRLHQPLEVKDRKLRCVLHWGELGECHLWGGGWPAHSFSINSDIDIRRIHISIFLYP